MRRNIGIKPMLFFVIVGFSVCLLPSVGKSNAPHSAQVGKGAEGNWPSITNLYDPSKKIDPFEPVSVAKPTQAAPSMSESRQRRLPLTPLQKVDLSQLRVVGIIISLDGNKALVEGPLGKGYVVHRGTYVGSNFGQVKGILKDRIIVEEKVEDYLSGEMKPQTRELRLRKRPGHV
ncbi:MAG: pilus assembly protein PilP [Deltaproteobacteria bacterium]|nr:pilus assembly protein PilP [Deltaproteobacteria bacterium]